MQTLTRINMVVMEDYGHMTMMNENMIGWNYNV